VFTVVRPLPVAEFLFDNAGDPGIDSSGHGNNLDVVGTARTYVDPTRGNVLFLDNPGDDCQPHELSYLAFMPGKDGSLMNSIPTGNSPYTIAAWIFPIGHQENGIIGWGNYGNNNEVTSLQTEGWSQLLQVWWSRDLRTDVGIFKDKWSHVACTYNGTYRACFWNGEEKGHDWPQPHNARSENFHVGHTHHNMYFDGYMDDVRVFDVAITKDHMAQLALLPGASMMFVTALSMTKDAFFGALVMNDDLPDHIAAGAGALFGLFGLVTLMCIACTFPQVNGGGSVAPAAAQCQKQATATKMERQSPHASAGETFMLSGERFVMVALPCPIPDASTGSVIKDACRM
jgi:hypothetical protein